MAKVGIISKYTKQILNTKSSTEPELVGKGYVMAYVLWRVFGRDKDVTMEKVICQ